MSDEIMKTNENAHCANELENTETRMSTRTAEALQKNNASIRRAAEIMQIVYN